jgi:RNA polymerase sigma factor (sigma-70 family)
MDPRQLLADEWGTVERLIAMICRKRGLVGADADIFASMVKIKLFENECEIVRNFRGESKFATYLNIVIHHTFTDFHVKRLGKWHPSAVAKREGPVAIELERMIHRDRCPVDEAISRLHTAHPDVSRDQLTAIFRMLPQRNPRYSAVSLETVGDRTADDEEADILVVERERRAFTERTAAIVRRFLERLDDRDRLMLQFHFESDMQLSQIARILGVEQKPLYRRREQLLRDMKNELLADGITAEEVAGLIGHLPEESDFGLRKTELRPTESERGVTAQPEIPR